MDVDAGQLPQVEATPPPRTTIAGEHVQLRPLEVSDATDLYETIGNATHSQLWNFMPDGPFSTLEAFTASIAHKAKSMDPLFFTVVNTSTGVAVGHVAFMRISVPHRTIELGNIIFSPLVQRSRITTECIYLMLRCAFDRWRFRRCEWKCDDRNGPSKRAAGRFGFVGEGVFRQHMVVKGRNRDTAWFSVLDGREWEEVKGAFEAWLEDGNFAESGRQRRGLEEMRSRKGGPQCE